MEVQLAVERDIASIIEIIKQRCEWFEQNRIEQWGDWYYTELYNAEYFIKAMKEYHLYVIKQAKEIIGVFLLKDEDQDYWNDNEKAYYIHHLVTKIGYPGLGIKILDFIEELAKQNEIKYLRLDCIRTNQKLNQYYLDYGFKEKGQGEEGGVYFYRLWEKTILSS